MNIDRPTDTQLPALQSLWQEAFGDTDEFLKHFYSTAYSADRCRCVTSDKTVAAALYWFDCLYQGKKAAYLYAIATARHFRGHGICHQLMENTHRHLQALGYEGVLLVPGDKTLFSFYEAMGYQTCCYQDTLSCSAAKQPVPLRQITKTEYAALRRKFLPQNGILQENENLDFLETQAVFYSGMDFLLAARIGKDVLFGLELLGNKTAAPGIVKALLCSSGVFRTPGGDIPFAMYHSLTGQALPAPAYFGLAFD